MQDYLDFLFAAEGGGTIQTPEGTIDKSNVHQYRERFEARLAIYRAAIEQRGYESFAGNYDASATEIVLTRWISLGWSRLSRRCQWSAACAGGICDSAHDAVRS